MGKALVRFYGQMKIKDLLAKAEATLSASSTSPRLDAELLLCHLLQWRREKLLTSMTESVDAKEIVTFEGMLKERANGTPVAYITGTKEFWKHTFFVSPAVLIPRPETELIVETAVTYLRNRSDTNPFIVDLGTGSGCIACSIAYDLIEIGFTPRVIATDKSSDALQAAKKNIERLKLSNVIELRLGDWFTPIDDCKGEADLIVSNPPYVSTKETVSSECHYEPAEALYSAEEGLQDVKKIISSLPRFLKANGQALIEIGSNQGSSVAEFAAIKNLSAEILKDLGGKDRVVSVTNYG